METYILLPNRARETDSDFLIGQMETRGLKFELSNPCGLFAARTASDSIASCDMLHTLLIPVQ